MLKEITNQLPCLLVRICLNTFKTYTGKAEGSIMPTITVEGPKIKGLEIKRALVKEFTESAARAYGLPVEVIVVLIKENLPDNVGVGGQLLADRKKPDM